MSTCTPGVTINACGDASCNYVQESSRGKLNKAEKREALIIADDANRLSVYLLLGSANTHRLCLTYLTPSTLNSLLCAEPVITAIDAAQVCGRNHNS